MNLSKGVWKYKSGQVVDSEVGVVLKAERDNPKTLPIENDSNILMAAKSKNMFAAILNFLLVKEELQCKKRLTKADKLKLQETEDMMKWSIDDRSVR